jgi:hypothetical protein
MLRTVFAIAVAGLIAAGVTDGGVYIAVAAGATVGAVSVAGDLTLTALV